MFSFENEIISVINDLKKKGYRRYSKELENNLDSLIVPPDGFLDDTRRYHDYKLSIYQAKSLSLDKIEHALIEVDPDVFAINRENIMHIYYEKRNQAGSSYDVNAKNFTKAFDDDFGLTKQEIDELADYDQYESSVYRNSPINECIMTGMELGDNVDEINHRIDALLSNRDLIFRYEHKILQINDDTLSLICSGNSLIVGLFYDKFDYHQQKMFFKKFGFYDIYHKQVHDVFKKELEYIHEIKRDKKGIYAPDFKPCEHGIRSFF